MKTLLITCILLITTTAQAADKWTTEDKALEIAWMGLHLVDWGQTRDIASQPKCENYHETNPILGRHPKTEEIDIYMGLWCLLHPMVSSYLPTEIEFAGFVIKPRRIWQSASIGVTGGWVVKNFSIGLKMEF